MAQRAPARGSNAAHLAAAVRAIPDHPVVGIVFRDITPLLADPTLFSEAVNAMAERSRGFEPDVVVGIEARGFILGGAIAHVLGAGFVPIRKEGTLPAATESVAYALEYGTGALEIHADALRPGQRVVVVDDLLATGGTAAAAVALVERLGGVVAGLTFLIELADLGGAKALQGHPHTSLITL